MCVLCILLRDGLCRGREREGEREREIGGVIGNNVVGQFNPIADQHKQCTITTCVSVVGFASSGIYHT